jgi:hypothetical protein
MVLLVAAAALPGCASQSQLTAFATQARVLTEENRAQLVEIDNLRAHSRLTEDKLLHTEQELALLQEQNEVDRQRLAGLQHGADQLQAQCQNSAGRLPSTIRQQLVALSQRYPSLHFDPATGISKLDSSTAARTL